MMVGRPKDGRWTQRFRVDLPMVLCMGFAHGFGHDGFLPIVFCIYGQGNYDYIII